MTTPFVAAFSALWRTGRGISSDRYYFTNMRDAYPAVISQQFAGANLYGGG
jgi:hypothetical protein